MKTKTIKSLKKEVLVIELPINGYWEVLSTETRFKCFDTGEKLILKNYTLLGKPDEITRDDVMDLVEVHEFGYVKVSENHLNSPLRHFHSAIEKELFWVNPFEQPTQEKYGWYSANSQEEESGWMYEEGKEIYYQKLKEWQESQEKTFDKSRTLIFIKN